MIKLVAFLGNYGKEYERTRHNTAWQFADSLPFYSRLNWNQKFQGQYAQVDFNVFCEWVKQFYPQLCKEDGSLVMPKNPPDKIFFLKPETYMNLSGDSIIKVAQFYKIKPDEIMVVHDELELVPGIYSLKWGGGLAGHNGLRSTKAVLGTADFWRIRFGIGRPAGKDIADYVLSNFTGDEAITMSLAYQAAGELLARALMASDAQRLLPLWAKKKAGE
ncbi:MAG: aminoacyl-tRNA hydrolase [Treponema sp.]|nr:aminoacyl-tRNA hydrolase [Treponema sp.]